MVDSAVVARAWTRGSDACCPISGSLSPNRVAVPGCWLNLRFASVPYGPFLPQAYDNTFTGAIRKIVMAWDQSVKPSIRPSNGTVLANIGSDENAADACGGCDRRRGGRESVARAPRLAGRSNQADHGHGNRDHVYLGRSARDDRRSTSRPTGPSKSGRSAARTRKIVRPAAGTRTR